MTSRQRASRTKRLVSSIRQCSFEATISHLGSIYNQLTKIVQEPGPYNALVLGDLRVSDEVFSSSDFAVSGNKVDTFNQYVEALFLYFVGSVPILLQDSVKAIQDAESIIESHKRRWGSQLRF